jgi:hypothetical protein
MRQANNNLALSLVDSDVSVEVAINNNSLIASSLPPMAPLTSHTNLPCFRLGKEIFSNLDLPWEHFFVVPKEEELKLSSSYSDKNMYSSGKGRDWGDY